MKIVALRPHAFAIPYARTMATARGRSAARYGVIVELETDTGVTGLGEASPYPGPDEREAQRDVLWVLRKMAVALQRRDIRDAESELDRALADADASAPVKRAARAGVETALWDARGKLAGVPVAQLMGRRPRRCVEVNALVVDPEVEAARHAAREAANAGFRAVKLKVGMARSVEQECARVASVRGAIGPDVALRLDANGAWDVATALRTLRAVAGYDIEYVEQPVPPHDLEAMRRARELAGVRVAADESVTDVAAARRLLDAGAADVLVVKPLVVGGIGPALDISRLAAERGVAVTVTTTFDSGAGIAVALHVAALLPEGSPACGLATAHLLESDLLTAPLMVQGGVMGLPAAPGLGVELDRAALARYAVASTEGTG